MQEKSSYHLIKVGEYFISGYDFEDTTVNIDFDKEEEYAFKFDNAQKDFNRILAMFPNAKCVHYETTTIRTEYTPSVPEDDFDKILEAIADEPFKKPKKKEKKGGMLRCLVLIRN